MKMDTLSRKDRLHCVECGVSAPELYRILNCGIIKIAHCKACRRVVDKYVEFDPVVVLLDILLFKPQAYRHILFNMDLKFKWKLCIICLLCAAYLKWAFNHTATEVEDTRVRPFLQYALQIDFYMMMLLAAMDLAAYLGGITIACKIHSSMGKSAHIEDRLPIIHSAIVLSQAGKLLVIPAVVWGQTNILTCFWLTELFVFTFMSQSLRVTLNCSRLTVACVLLAGYLCEITASQLGQTLQQFLTDR